MPLAPKSRLLRAWLSGTVMSLVLVLVAALSARAEQATDRQAMVATVHPLATEAGLQALRDGGNAVDAAVAAALMLGVVDNHNSGIGGGCFILVRRSDGRVVAIDGRETAPAAARRDMYVRDGQARTELSQRGPLAVAVPGAVAAYAKAVQEHGRKQLAELLRPAAETAEQGFALDRSYAQALQETAPVLAQFPSTRAVLLKPNGEPYQEGELLRQPDLARTYRAIAEQGPEWFYDGPFAQQIERWMSEHGGIMTAADLAAYEAKEREPILTTYRDYTLVGFPPPSSGGVHVAEILNILETFDLAALHRDDPASFVHVVLEAMKLAMADRAYWLGDADFAPVPRGLLDKQYARELAARIDLERAIEVPGHGTPPAWQTSLFGQHTTHIAAADAEGNWVAITATVNTTFGSKIILPGTGVVLNNEMDDFAIQPGVPNAFGLVGAEANSVAPGKRPLSSMSPTIVLRDNQPVMTLGAAGGPRIITQVVLALVRHLDLQMPLDQAVAAPRVHHQWFPDVAVVENTLAEEIVNELQRRGHEVRRERRLAVLQAISNLGDEPLQGVHDPRVPGRAAGLGE